MAVSSSSTPPAGAGTDAPKLAWTTPQLDQIGSIRDVAAGGNRPPNDGSASPVRLSS